jgi:hypothetical protein
MRKAKSKSGSARRTDRAATQDDILPRYDFSRGVRGKYAARYREGTNVVLLEPDVAKRFPDAAAVNRALRVLAEVADGAKPEARTPRRTG